MSDIRLSFSVAISRRPKSDDEEGDVLPPTERPFDIAVAMLEMVKISAILSSFGKELGFETVEKLIVEQDPTVVLFEIGVEGISPKSLCAILLCLVDEHLPSKVLGFVSIPHSQYSWIEHIGIENMCMQVEVVGKDGLVVGAIGAYDPAVLKPLPTADDLL